MVDRLKTFKERQKEKKQNNKRGRMLNIIIYLSIAILYTFAVIKIVNLLTN